MKRDTPGFEGALGPFRPQYGDPHVYARDVWSGAGNCVCGRALGAALHTQAAPGVPIPDMLRIAAMASERPAEQSDAPEPEDRIASPWGRNGRRRQ